MRETHGKQRKTELTEEIHRVIDELMKEDDENYQDSIAFSNDDTVGQIKSKSKRAVRHFQENGLVALFILARNEA